MAGPKAVKTPTHVAPAEPPLKVAVAPVPSTECCASCKGAIRGMDSHLRCHGQPPAARYTNHVMGVGPSADALWPKVDEADWCMAWKPRLQG